MAVEHMLFRVFRDTEKNPNADKWSRDSTSLAVLCSLATSPAVICPESAFSNGPLRFCILKMFSMFQPKLKFKKITFSSSFQQPPPYAEGATDSIKTWWTCQNFSYWVASCCRAFSLQVSHPGWSSLWLRDRRRRSRKTGEQQSWRRSRSWELGWDYYIVQHKTLHVQICLGYHWYQYHQQCWPACPSRRRW